MDALFFCDQIRQLLVRDEQVEKSMTEGKYRFGIVGIGMISEFHAKAIQAMEDAELVAAYSRSGGKADCFADRYGCEIYRDLEAFLAHPDLDIVTICTPSGAHLDPALAAAKAGKHVVVEKPLEVTIERIDAMKKACEENGVNLISILPRRFYPSTQLLRGAIEAGRLGRLTMAEAQIKWYRTQEYYDSGAWRGTWALDGGGALMNQSIHTIDLLLHLMGPVKRVSAFAGQETHARIEVEDVAVAILEFENGARGVIQGSTTCYSKSGHPAQIQICGSEGSVFMVDDRFSVWDFEEQRESDGNVLLEFGLDAEKGSEGAADPSAIDFSWHQRNFEEAIAMIGEGRASIVGCDEGRKAVELICAIYKSAQSGGQVVELPLEATPEFRNFGEGK